MILICESFTSMLNEAKRLIPIKVQRSGDMTYLNPEKGSGLMSHSFKASENDLKLCMQRMKATDSITSPNRKKGLTYKGMSKPDPKKGETFVYVWKSKYPNSKEAMEALLKRNKVKESYSFNGTKNISKFTKELLLLGSDTILEYYGINPNSIDLNFHLTNKKGNHIVLNEKAIASGIFEVFLDKNDSHSDLLTFLSHELTHVKQVLQGDLSFNEDKVLWKNKEFDLIDGTKDYESYKNSPWEKEAYSNQENLRNNVLSSSDYESFIIKWRELFETTPYKDIFTIEDLVEYQTPENVLKIFKK